MSHKKRRQKFLEIKERQRMRQEPVLPAEPAQSAIRELDPYDFGLFRTEPDSSPSSAVDKLVEAQRQTAAWVEMSTIQALVGEIRHREGSVHLPALTNDFSQAQTVLMGINTDLQTRELFQIHKALNGGVYLP